MPTNSRVATYTMTAQQSADYLDVTLARLIRWSDKGRLPFLKLSHAKKFCKDDLDAFVERCEASITASRWVFVASWLKRYGEAVSIISVAVGLWKILTTEPSVPSISIR